LVGVLRGIGSPAGVVGYWRWRRSTNGAVSVASPASAKADGSGTATRLETKMPEEPSVK
jgi:hypothetical protein